MPPYAFYWKYSTMSNSFLNLILEYFEKGIHNDFRRVHSKGKTLADVP